MCSKPYQWIVAAWILLTFGQVCESYEPTTAYKVISVEKWTVRVHKTLAHEQPELTKRALKSLQNHLYRINQVIPANSLPDLHKVVIWVENFDPRHPCACYHVDRGWLKRNDFNPEKTGGVEISNPRNLIDWSVSQPWMILHELAHAYHHQVLGADHRELLEAFEKAKKSGAYEKVLRYKGTQERHYALNNVKEYFAEATEAYFGANDFYPFVNAELKKHDPTIHALMGKLWKEK